MWKLWEGKNSDVLWTVSVRLIVIDPCVNKMPWCLKGRKQAPNWSNNIDACFIGHHSLEFAGHLEPFRFPFY
jgi:hypothetical protein